MQREVADHGRGGSALVVAALSARYLAEAARRAGWRVIALDLFGDADTRRAADWRPIGVPGRLAVDPARLRQALADAARDRSVTGWIAGGGFDGEAELLDAGADRLPRLGMSTAAVVALRTPRHFFATLDRLALRHPDVAWTPPADPAGWLHKRGRGSGGWQIAPAGPAVVSCPDGYFQRRLDAPAMSALCLADGHRGRLVALNHQRAQALTSSRPCVFAGLIGPVHAPALQRRVEEALEALVPAFGLRGLLSLDFLCVDGEPWWLEVNPRPPASLQLYDGNWPGGLIGAHLDALRGHLPAPPLPALPGWRGVETLYAPMACRLDDAQALADDPALRDLPMPGAHFGAGAPVCTVTHRADDETALRRGLAARLEALRRRLVVWPHDTPEEETVR